MLSILSVLLAQAAAQPQAGKWSLAIAGGQCTLSRPLDGAALTIKSVPGLDSYTFTLAGGELPTSLPPFPATVGLVFDGAAGRFDRFASAVSSGAGGMVIWQGVPGSALDAFAHSTSITIETKDHRWGPYTYSKSDVATDALRKCESDQLGAWGADPAQFANGGTRPVPLKDRDNWLPNDQIMALSADGSVNAVYRLSISAGGIVNSCDTVASNNAVADKKVCKALVLRKLVRPATDSSGHPVPGVVAYKVDVFVKKT